MNMLPRLSTLLAELLVLVGIVTVGSVVGAFHTFRPYGEDATRTAMLFALLASLAAAAPYVVYAGLRLRQLVTRNTGLQNAVTTDALTGVLNRRGFEAQAQRMIHALGMGVMDGGVLLLIVDADHFKRINDRLGHPTGDVALKAIASTLRTTLRTTDVVGRIGGEEFGVALICPSLEQGAIVAERIRRTVARLSVGRGAEASALSVSLGGTFARGPQTYAALYQGADENLYAAKKAGRNRVVLSPFAPAGGRYFKDARRPALRRVGS